MYDFIVIISSKTKGVTKKLYEMTHKLKKNVLSSLNFLFFSTYYKFLFFDFIV